MIILMTSDTFTMNCTIRIAGTKGIRMDESEYLDRMGSEKIIIVTVHERDE
jgi:hypothetical protein